ncbi:MAG: AraC family transcriptional regulator [Oscillospiraceae bacterium]
MKVLQIDAGVLHTYRAYISAGQAEDVEKGAIHIRHKLNETQSNGFCRFKKDVLCSPLDGNGMLIIETDNGELIRFLLDVPIIVKQDVWFCVAAYNCDLEFEIIGFGIAEEKDTPNSNLINGMVPQVFVTSIFSVLYQTKNHNRDQRQFKHFYWELTYVDYGQLICEVDGKSFSLEKGDLMFFTPFQKHKVLNGSQNPVGFFTITFDINNQRFAELKNKIIRSDSTVRHLVKDMLSEYNLNMLFFNEMIASQLLSLLIHVLRVDSDCVVDVLQNRDNNISDNEIVQKAIQIAEEGLPHKASADTIADDLYISATKLRRVFRQEMGISISDYIRNRKLEMAKIMLSKGDCSITQISDLLEFCSVCYFSTEFKKKFGMQPKEYEKSIMKLNP